MPLRDGSGNAIRTTQNGSALDTRRYEAFGRLRSGSAGFLPRGFAGLPTEGSSGLYYASARHYDPKTGRFLQPDPARLYQPNLYAYAVNNPVVFGDPTGLAAGLSLSGFPDWLTSDSLMRGAGAPSYWERFGSGSLGLASGAASSAHDFMRFAEGGDPTFFENAFWGAASQAGFVAALAGFTGPAKSQRAWYELAQPETHGALVASLALGMAGSRIAGIGAAGSDAASFGTKVFRVYGENNNPFGESWTNVDPRTIPNFRAEAGLPDVNTGRFLLEGRLLDPRGVTYRKALPLDGNSGGAPELVIPDAKTKVLIERVLGLNPEF